MFLLGMQKCFKIDKSYYGAGSDLLSGKKDSPGQCQDWCQQTPACELFTYALDSGYCYLKSRGWNPQLKPALNKVSGPKYCPGKC